MADLIQYGTYDLTTSESKDIPITFSQAFSTIPTVVVSMDDPGYDTDVPISSVGAKYRTTTSFLLCFRTSATYDQSVSIHWVAIGQGA